MQTLVLRVQVSFTVTCNPAMRANTGDLSSESGLCRETERLHLHLMNLGHTLGSIAIGRPLSLRLPKARPAKRSQRITRNISLGISVQDLLCKSPLPSPQTSASNWCRRSDASFWALKQARYDALVYFEKMPTV